MTARTRRAIPAQNLENDGKIPDRPCSPPAAPRVSPTRPASLAGRTEGVSRSRCSPRTWGRAPVAWEPAATPSERAGAAGGQPSARRRQRPRKIVCGHFWDVGSAVRAPYVYSRGAYELGVISSGFARHPRRLISDRVLHGTSVNINEQVERHTSQRLVQSRSVV